MKSYLQESDIENQTSVSNSIETLNEVTYETKESILLYQSTFSTLNYEPNLDTLEKLKDTRLNINSLRNRFGSFALNNLDILLNSETKIDSLFPTA